MNSITLAAVDKIEILTLQDNYIEMTAMDNNAIITRAVPLKDGEFRASVLAEHGFSALVKTTVGPKTHTLLFDLGFSPHGAAENVKTLGVDLTDVEAIALSHGHSDHTGGIAKMTALISKKGIPFVVHPAIFKSPRYLKPSDAFKINFPKLTREVIKQAGLSLIESAEPYPLLDNNFLFLEKFHVPPILKKAFPSPALWKEILRSATRLKTTRPSS